MNSQSRMSLSSRQQTSPSRSYRPLLIGSILMALFGGVPAFQLSMVASRVPFGQPQSQNSPLQPRQRQNRQPFAPPMPGGGVSSSLISHLAVAALKLRLRQFGDVTCDATASPSDLLLHGRVGPVTVGGKGWGSRLGLTCRKIDATVDTCELDIGRVLSQRKLRLTRPAEGRAMIAFDATDFGNFITHPLMRPPSLPESDTGDAQPTLTFSKEGTTIDPATGSITFFGNFQDARWKFILKRATDNSHGGKALILAEKADGNDDDSSASTAEQLTAVVTHFFNEMVFELDGTFLAFKDLMVTDKSVEPTVMLSLGIIVRKFPSPGLEF